MEYLFIQECQGIFLEGFGNYAVNRSLLLHGFRGFVYPADIFDDVADIAAELGVYFLVQLGKVVISFVLGPCPFRKVVDHPLQVPDTVRAGQHGVVAHIFILAPWIGRIGFGTEP